MSQNSSHQTEAISFYKRVHVSFIYPFTKNTVLGYVSDDFHKKVLVPLGDALTATWNYFKKVHKLSAIVSQNAHTYLKTVSGN